MAASAAERKLMAELEQMKALVASLQANGGGGGAASSGNPDADRIIAELQAKLMEKQSDLQTLNDGDGNAAERAQSEQQRQEYARRGISLAVYDSESNTQPYFVNLDADAFRSNRFMYILSAEREGGRTVFGPKGDIQLMSLAVVRDHCTARVDGEAGKVFLTAGKGDTWRNGQRLEEGVETELAVFDRVAVGDQLMLFRWPGKEEGAGDMMSGEDAVEEFQVIISCIINKLSFIDDIVHRKQ